MYNILVHVWRPGKHKFALMRKTPVRDARFTVNKVQGWRTHSRLITAFEHARALAGLTEMWSTFRHRRLRVRYGPLLRGLPICARHRRCGRRRGLLICDVCATVGRVPAAKRSTIRARRLCLFLDPIPPNEDAGNWCSSGGDSFTSGDACRARGRLLDRVQRTPAHELNTLYTQDVRYIQIVKRLKRRLSATAWFCFAGTRKGCSNNVLIRQQDDWLSHTATAIGALGIVKSGGPFSTNGASRTPDKRFTNECAHLARSGKPLRAHAAPQWGTIMPMVQTNGVLRNVSLSNKTQFNADCVKDYQIDVQTLRLLTLFSYAFQYV